MCGIVGFVSKEDFDAMVEMLPRAVASLSHRGPDDSGLFFYPQGGVGLGHRRLSVIDLSSSGRQPMKSDDGRVHLVFNGEVYNFRDIRKTLEGYGHRFHTATDTEVLLKAYLQWDTDCLQRLVGMFAFALWDNQKNRLFLARDRLGIKPLYYYCRSRTVLFASELKGLMAFGAFPRDLNPEAVPLFLHYQYIPAPKTVFKHTFKLLPGHYALYDARGMRVAPYWEGPGENSRKAPCREAEAVEELDRLLRQAVSDCLISDVPLGAFLSGGIDSSTVVALMQKINRTPVRTFTIGFREEGYDEAPWASKVARHLGTDHSELYVSPKEALEVIPRLPEIYDEPFADASAIPTFLVCRMSGSRATVALSGDGGDEQLCGYVRYWSTRAMDRLFKHIPGPLQGSLSRILETIPSRWVERCYRPWVRHLPQRFQAANFADKWEKLIKSMQKSGLSELYRMTVCLWPGEDLVSLTGKSLPWSRYEEAFAATEGWPVLSRLMYVDRHTYLPDAMLTKLDRASMAVGLEVRVPLLDHRVVEFTSGLPETLKYKGGSGKYLLKKLLERYVPATLYQRPKMGFGVPIDRWFRNELRTCLLDYLSSERLKREGLFEPSVVACTIREHLSGRANHQYRLWCLLMWEMWRERWL